MSRVKKLARRRANAKFERNMIISFFINLRSVSYSIEYNWKQRRMALKWLEIFNG